MAGKITPVDKHPKPGDVPTTTVVPVLFEITTEDAHGHRTVHRVRADSEDEALDLLPIEAPDVVEVRRP